MHAPPLDYAIDDDAPDGAAATTGSGDGDITLASLFDRHAAALPVTETMIRDAWRRMESGHRFAFDASGTTGHVSIGPDASVMARGMLGRTLRRFRPNA